MEKLLVPIDFSDESKNALKFAVKIARQEKATIDLLNVIEQTGKAAFSATGEPPSSNVNMDDVFTLKLMKKTKADLHKLIEENSYEDVVKGYKVEVDAVAPLHEAITNAVEKNGYDAVVMGTKGSKGLNEIIFGSNTEKVVRNATCPVFTIKKGIDVNSIKDVVFPSDFQEDLDITGRKLKEIENFMGARIHMLYVDPYKDHKSKESAFEAMEDFASKHGITNYTHNIIENNNVEKGIEEFTKKLGNCMIAIVTHGKSGFEQFFFNNSVAEALVNHSQHAIVTLNTVMEEELAS